MPYKKLKPYDKYLLGFYYSYALGLLILNPYTHVNELTGKGKLYINLRIFYWLVLQIISNKTYLGHFEPWLQDKGQTAIYVLLVFKLFVRFFFTSFKYFICLNHVNGHVGYFSNHFYYAALTLTSLK